MNKAGNDPDIHAAAQKLHDLLLSQFVNRAIFSVGSGSEHIHVYVRCPKNRWPVAVLEVLNDIPIEWHWNVGPIIAGGAP